MAATEPTERFVVMAEYVADCSDSASYSDWPLADRGTQFERRSMCFSRIALELPAWFLHNTDALRAAFALARAA